MHVVVTGASSGIGRDLAKVFDVPGNSISVVARRKTLLEELQKEISVPTQAIEADLADEYDPIGWLVRAEQGFGPVDILINNAGVSYIEPTHQIDAVRIRTLFQVRSSRITTVRRRRSRTTPRASASSSSRQACAS